MKVVTITRNDNPWAVMVRVELRRRGVEVAVVNQTGEPKRHNLIRPAFVRRHGLTAHLDLLLQRYTAELAGWRRRRHKTIVAGYDVSDSTITFDDEKPTTFVAVLQGIQRAPEAGHSIGPWYETASANSEDTIAFIRDLNPDLTALCGAPILRKSAIESLGTIINPHAGIVPQYRGSSPVEWPVYRRDWNNIGFTLHRVTPTVDGGPVILQERASIRTGWTMNDLVWFVMFTMYDRLVTLITAPDWRQQIENAVSQPENGNSWPPMGVVRQRVAESRLRKYLQEQ